MGCAPPKLFGWRTVERETNICAKMCCPWVGPWLVGQCRGADAPPSRLHSTPLLLIRAQCFAVSGAPPC